MMDVAKTNTVEGELDFFVARRDEQRRRAEGERPAEEIWQESVRRYNARRQRELCWEWLRYHVARQRANRKTFALLDAMHETEIQKYSQMLGLDDHEPNGKDAA